MLIRGLAFAGVMALAAWLRFYGITWGLPSGLHNYSYHPDEFLTVTAAFLTIYAGRSLNPRFYNYPSLYLYLSALALAVAFGYGVDATLSSAYLIPRVLTALMGVGAVVATYWAGIALFSWEAGAVAALLLAVAPLHVQHSHFATVDVPSTLWVALALGCAGLVLKRGDWRSYLLGGVMSGLAAGTKYNAGLVILAVIAAHFLRGGRVRDCKPFACVGCALGAFALSTPGSLLWPGQFLYGFTYELRHAAQGHGLVFAGTGNGLFYTMSNLRYALSLPVVVFAVVALVMAARLRCKPVAVLAAFALPYVVLIATSQVKFARYLMPLAPALALVVGWFFVRSIRVARGSGSISRICVWIGLVVLALVWSVVDTAGILGHFAGPDPRDDAARWVFRNVPKGSRIGVIDVPWFYSPPLSANLGAGVLEQRRDAARNAPYQIVIFSDSHKPGAWFTDGTPPRWVIVSDFETSDALRLAGNTSLTAAQDAEARRIRADLDLLNSNYTRRASFGRSGRQRYPHDMRYPSPAIDIYELKR